LQFRALDDDVGEIEQTHFERIQHSFAGHDDLFGLFFHRKRTNHSDCFFGRLPFGQLTQTFLTGPHRRVNDFQEQLTSARIENENGPIDRLPRQISFESFVDGDTVDVGVVGEPNELI